MPQGGVRGQNTMSQCVARVQNLVYIRASSGDIHTYLGSAVAQW